MPCYFPVGTYRKDGKPCFRPCGSCLGCRLEYSRQWAVRCVHEAQMHDEENAFITLTYNDQNLPKDKNISKNEVQNFMKNLRSELNPKKIRFFGCGEYGDDFDRPHYHICIFGYQFPDKEIIYLDEKRRGIGRQTWKRGHDHTIYRSKTLENIWKKGFSSVGNLTFESAGYVARYSVKKINGKEKSGHYGDRTPEFALMSRNPGIGRTWIEKYLNDVYPKDFFTLNGHKMRPVRYYDTVCEKLKPKMFKKIKEERIRNSENKEPETGTRQMQRYFHKQKITKPLGRTLHGKS